MPARTAFYPPNDTATHRDLLLFEERLKTNAASLNRRKRRYQLFLTQLLLSIVSLLSEVLLHTNVLVYPCQWVLSWAAPSKLDSIMDFHRYIAVGLLCVAVTTLGLFFVSGMYSEKIAYANRYVPHANRSLRNFNMYLNVRQPPLLSKLPFNPFSLLFARSPHTPSPPPSPSADLVRRRSQSPSSRKRSSSVPIAPIPPASNPRGELIFSSRVDRGFREGYDRFRTSWERRRDEKERAAFQTTWIGWLHMKLTRSPPVVLSSVPKPTGADSGTATPVEGGHRRTMSLRGRGGKGGSAPSSRRSSPGPIRATGTNAGHRSPRGSSGLGLSNTQANTDVPGDASPLS